MPSTAAFEALEQFNWRQMALGAAFLAPLWYTVSSILAWYKLRHIPGPLFASFSYVWGTWVASTGRIDRIMEAEQKKYGSIMRIGPDAITIYDPETILRINGARSTYTKGFWYESLRIDYRGSNVISEFDIPKHATRKARLASAFSGKNVLLLESKVDKWIAALIHCIHGKISKGEEIIDIGKLLQYFQVDLISEVGMGAPWGDLADEKDNFGFLKMNDSFLPVVQSIAWLPAARAIFLSKWFMKLAGPKTTDTSGLGLYMGIVEKEVRKRFRDKSEKSNSGGNILDEWIKQGLPADECQYDLSLLVPAGAETSVMTIRGTLLLLMSSPVVYAKVKQEIKNGIAVGYISDPITNEEAKNLEYVQALVREGMRLMAPIASGFPKRVPASGDTICGKFIPAGTDVYPNLYCLMRNKDVFGEDAEVFRPERFLGKGPKIARMVRTVDFSFGSGRFLCLGKALAQIELNKIFVQLLRNFDFQIANPEKPWTRSAYVSCIVHDFWAQVSDDTMMG
ncbi:cytochrome P450 [Xylariaceae sp. FL1651]|nr:cytochrome P450 [Xylariaceae sp. FL1651]